MRNPNYTYADTRQPSPMTKGNKKAPTFLFNPFHRMQTKGATLVKGEATPRHKSGGKDERADRSPKPAHTQHKTPRPNKRGPRAPKK